MARNIVYSCDCGRESCKATKKETNHWALFKIESGTLVFKEWDAILADDPNWGHLYGDDCINVVVSKWRHKQLEQAHKE